MTKQKKPYVKPEFTIIRAGTPRYTQILTALEAEGQPPQPQSDVQAKEPAKKEASCV